ncbi:MAG: hypothetical protein ACI4O7_05255, partial [Aristaeellaceae bacterium]
MPIGKGAAAIIRRGIGAAGSPPPEPAGANKNPNRKTVRIFVCPIKNTAPDTRASVFLCLKSLAMQGS